MSAAWFDARGCLSTEGVAALQQAPPGGAPAELAGHLAACPRCQQRVLALELGPRTPRKVRSDPWRNLALLGLALLAALILMGTTAWVIRR